MKSDPKFGWAKGGVSYTNARKKGSKTLFGLCPEKELPEWRSNAFHHKITPGSTLIKYYP
jgi:hypothetical protein